MPLPPDALDLEFGFTQPERPFWEPIGKYVFQFGFLERDIDWALSALLGLDFFLRGRMVFAQIPSLPTKLNLLGALAKRATRTEAFHLQIDEIVDQIQKQRSFRNSLVHGAWNGYMVEQCVWQKMEISSRLRFKPFEVSVEKIEKHYRELMPVGVALSNLIQTIMNELHATVAPPPSHDTPPPPIDGES